MADVKKEVTKNGLLLVDIDGLPHLRIELKTCQIHSWIDEKVSYLDDNGIIQFKKFKMYYINFHLPNGSVVKAEYNNRDIWEAVLKGL